MKIFTPKSPSDPYYDVLRRCTQLRSISAAGSVEVYERGEHIVHSGEPIQTLRYLAAGKVKVVLLSRDGKQSIIRFLGEDSMIGDLSLIAVEDEPKDVVALGRCVFAAYPFEAVTPLLHSDAAFLYDLCVYLGKKLLSTTERFSQIANYPLKNRLAAFLLFTEQDGVFAEKKTEAAEYLGVSYRHLLFVLEQFISEGLLNKQKKSHAIADRQALEQLARDIRMF